MGQLMNDLLNQFIFRLDIEFKKKIQVSSTSVSYKLDLVVYKASLYNCILHLLTFNEMRIILA